MCKPPRREVPIPGAGSKGHREVDVTTANPKGCVNCGSRLRETGEAQQKPLVATTRVERSRFCTPECYYSYLFRTEVLGDEDEDDGSVGTEPRGPAIAADHPGRR